MRTAICLVSLACWMCACASVPLTTTARLAVNPEGRIIESAPSEIAIAFTSDQPLPSNPSAPHIVFQLIPKVAGAFDPLDERLITTKATQALPLNLDTSKNQYAFVLTPDSQQALSRAQTYFARLRAAKKGGSLTIAVNMNSLFEAAQRMPEEARLTVWLRTSRREGYFKMWSGNALDARQQLRAAQTPARGGSERQ